MNKMSNEDLEKVNGGAVGGLNLNTKTYPPVPEHGSATTNPNYLQTYYVVSKTAALGANPAWFEGMFDHIEKNYGMTSYVFLHVENGDGTKSDKVYVDLNASYIYHYCVED